MALLALQCISKQFMASLRLGYDVIRRGTRSTEVLYHPEGIYFAIMMADCTLSCTHGCSSNKLHRQNIDLSWNYYIIPIQSQRVQQKAAYFDCNLFELCFIHGYTIDNKPFKCFGNLWRFLLKPKLMNPIWFQILRVLFIWTLNLAITMSNIAIFMKNTGLLRHFCKK